MAEQADALPAASVAFALNVVVLPATTGAGIPAAPKAAAVPVAAGAPEQSAVLNSVTVEPASAVPLIAGVVLGEPEAGLTPVTVGKPGAAESWV